MADGEEVYSDGRLARPRRWPAAILAVVVASALCLTAFLFVRDRQNAAAATAARTNAPQDALALAAVQSLARTLNLDVSLRHAGVDGLRAIAMRDFESLVVAPLGGSMQTAPGQWTVALNGGFACLSRVDGRGDQGMAIARLGVCTDDAPLVTTPPITAAEFRAAERAVVRDERAAVDAAYVAAAISSTAQGYDPVFSLPALDTRFARLTHVPFRSWTATTGLTVATVSSAACLVPSASDAQVRVALGSCP